MKSHTQNVFLFVGFKTWPDVLEFVRDGGRVWYQAPLDPQPRSVVITRRCKNGKLRVKASTFTFWADEGHLDRFRQIRVHALPASTSV